MKNSVDVLLLALEMLHNSCNMGTHDLPEMYTCSLWAVPSDFGHTFQANHSTTINYLQHKHFILMSNKYAIVRGI